jgi:ubiquinone/menaquinone biosynthesis C-methylase UbiE
MDPKSGYKVDPRKEDHLGLYNSPMRRFLSGIRLSAISREVVKRVPAQSKILEVGCGHGQVLWSCYRRESTMVGIDINPLSVAIARRRFENKPNVTFLEGDVRKMDLKDGSFDCILCTEVIEHVPDPVEVLNEIKRLLKPGGIFVSTVPWEYLLVLLRTLILPVRLAQGRGVLVPEHLHYFTKSSYRNLLEKHFTVLTVRRVEFAIRVLAVCEKRV